MKKTKRRYLRPPLLVRKFSYKQEQIKVWRMWGVANHQSEFKLVLVTGTTSNIQDFKYSNKIE